MIEILTRVGKGGETVASGEAYRGFSTSYLDFNFIYYKNDIFCIPKTFIFPKLPMKFFPFIFTLWK